jgi:hypothetical protein
MYIYKYTKGTWWLDEYWITSKQAKKNVDGEESARNMRREMTGLVGVGRDQETI